MKDESYLQQEIYTISKTLSRTSTIPEERIMVLFNFPEYVNFFEGDEELKYPYYYLKGPLPRIGEKIRCGNRRQLYKVLNIIHDYNEGFVEIILGNPYDKLLL